MLKEDVFLQNERYRIVRCIHRHAMGAIYEGEDQHLGLKVALKETYLNGSLERNGMGQVLQKLARLRHAALPEIKDQFAAGHQQYTVLEYIGGKDLGEQLAQRRTPFAVEQVLMWAEQLLDALRYLHRQRPPLFHQDIRPQTLKHRSDGAITFVNFGLEYGMYQQNGQLGHWPAHVLGYASPEQLAGKPATVRSDLYSLAATLYTLLTAEIPPDARVRQQALKHEVPDPLKALHVVNEAVPLYLSQVIMETLALEPKQRPVSAVMMQQMLQTPPPEVHNPSALAQKEGMLTSLPSDMDATSSPSVNGSVSEATDSQKRRRRRKRRSKSSSRPRFSLVLPLWQWGIIIGTFVSLLVLLTLWNLFVS